jgi:hypothetical protein
MIGLLQGFRQNLLELADRVPDREAMLRQLHRISNRLGRMLVEQHQWDEARRLYQTSIEEATVAILRFPRTGCYREWLVTTLLNLATITEKDHNLGETEALLRRAVLHAEEWSRDDPAAGLIPPLIWSRRELARVLAGQGRHAEAGALLLANHRATGEAARDRPDATSAMERIRNVLDFQSCGPAPPPDPRADEVGPPDPLTLLASPQGDRLPPEAWAQLALRAHQDTRTSPPATAGESQDALAFSSRLTEVASAQRLLHRFEQARRTADRLAALGRLLVERNPSDHRAYLVLAEAFEQEGKNAWEPVENPKIIERSRYQAMAVTRRALELAPYDELTRHQLERREQKLNEFLRSRR